MIKNLYVTCFLLIPVIGITQVLDNLNGSLEAVGQYLIDDDKISTSTGSELRSNNYLRFIYSSRKIEASIQIESYFKDALLGFSPIYDKELSISTFAVSYNSLKLEATVGYFYEQFSSGLIYRSWEDRQLGLNNSLLGARIKYNVSNKIQLTGIIGKQKNGFELSKGLISGFTSNFEISKRISLGLNFINRYQKIEDSNSSDFTNLYSARLNYLGEKFYTNMEFVFKGKDALVEFGFVLENKQFTGNALLYNFGFFKNGFGFDATFRRMENMAMYTDREASENVYNELVLNYLPALTKQHSFSLANIYVYQSQPQLSFLTNGKSGEIGQQIDFFYKFKNSFLGKYNTVLAFNYSSWFALNADYDLENRNYSADYFKYGEKYYSDINLEIKNNWSKQWETSVTLMHQFYNKKILENSTEEIKTNIISIDTYYKPRTFRQLHFQTQHLWTKNDKKNWAGALIEYSFNKKYSIYVNDIYNYGNEQEIERIHYYNFGGTYKRGKTKFTVNYGRQRGGLICVGGVCRFVPNSNGLTFGMNLFI